MSTPALVEAAGRLEQVGETVVALVWTAEGAAAVAGDGSVSLFRPEEGLVWRAAEAHRGAALCACPSPDGVLTGGDDGRVMEVAPGGAVRELAAPGCWVVSLAASAASKAIVAASGKEAVLIRAGAGVIHRYTHPTTVEAVALEPNGRRFAATHYNGAAISWASNPDGKRKFLVWRGAHALVSWSPDARFLVTSLQENALHGWRLQDGKHFQMTGYPAKIRSLAFTADRAFLVTAGAPDIMMWPFAGQDGPMGKSAVSAGELETPVTAVAPHPSRPVIAAGSVEGEVVLAAQGGQTRPILVAPPEGAMVTAISWSADGRALAFGDDAGRVGLLDLSEALGA